jgi:hypothetical protein
MTGPLAVITHEDAVAMMQNNFQFRFAMRQGWDWDGRCYEYAGTGDSGTVMGTFVFRKSRLAQAA